MLRHEKGVFSANNWVGWQAAAGIAKPQAVALGFFKSAVQNLHCAFFFLHCLSYSLQPTAYVRIALVWKKSLYL